MSQPSDDQPLLDRQGLEILDHELCWDLLRSTGVARIGFVQAGEPLIMPINIAVSGHRVVFRTGTGSKLAAAVRHQAVAIQADHYDWDTPTGWSVLARGQAIPVDEADQISDYEALGLQPWADTADRSHWVQVLVDELTGRRILGH